MSRKPKLKAGEKPTLTESEYAKINRLIVQFVIDNEAAEKAKAAVEASREAILEALIPYRDMSANIVPGFVVSEKMDVDYDAEAALEFLLRAEYLAAAAPMLTVSDVGMTRIVALAKEDETVKSSLTLKAPAYKKAVIENHIYGLPYDALKQKFLLSVTVKEVKTGAALRDTLNVIPDADTSASK